MQWDPVFRGPPEGLGDPARDALVVLTTLAAIPVLLQPWRLLPLLLLCTVQLVDVVWTLPEVSNHFLLVALADATLLLAAAGRLRGERRAASLTEVFADARPFLRLLVLVLYGFAFFWKLNPDFLDGETSCAAVFYHNIAWLYRVFPEGELVRGAIIYGTLLLEAALPVLLWLRPTRRFAILIALVFHYGLALDALQQFSNFSSAMFPLLLCFAPESAYRSFETRLGWLVRRGALWRGIAVGAFAAGIAISLPSWPEGVLPYALVRHAFWLVYGALGVAVGFAIARDGGFPREAMLPARRSVLWLLPALALLNGCAPILGVKTRSSWQMYSNLRLEAAASNHFVVPRSLDLLGVLGDVVHVVESDDSGRLEWLRERRLGLTWHDFRLHTSHHPELAVTYARGGETHRVLRAGDDPELATGPTLLARKVFWFRPIGEGVGRVCQW